MRPHVADRHAGWRDTGEFARSAAPRWNVVTTRWRLVCWTGSGNLQLVGIKRQGAGSSADGCADRVADRRQGRCAKHDEQRRDRSLQGPLPGDASADFREKSSSLLRVLDTSTLLRGRHRMNAVFWLSMREMLILPCRVCVALAAISAGQSYDGGVFTLARRRTPGRPAIAPSRRQITAQRYLLGRRRAAQDRGGAGVEADRSDRAALRAISRRRALRRHGRRS